MGNFGKNQWSIKTGSIKTEIWGNAGGICLNVLKLAIFVEGIGESIIIYI